MVKSWQEVVNMTDELLKRSSDGRPSRALL